jgi:hypothetical protein
MSTENTTEKIRKPRAACQYTPAERNVIRVHKEEYRSQPTRALRVVIFKTKILPDIFNYWTNDGALSFSPDDIKQCVHVSVANGRQSSLMLLF